MSSEDTEQPTDASRILTLEHYIEAVTLCNHLALLAAQGCIGDFQVRMKLLSQLKECWTKGHSDIKLVCCSDSATSNIHDSDGSESMAVSWTLNKDDEEWDASSDSTVDLKLDMLLGSESPESRSEEAEIVSCNQQSTRAADESFQHKESNRQLKTGRNFRKHANNGHGKKSLTSSSVPSECPKTRRQRKITKKAAVNSIDKGHVSTTGATAGDDMMRVDNDVDNEYLPAVARRTYTVCDVCCRRFATTASLAKHLRQVHHLEPNPVSDTVKVDGNSSNASSKLDGDASSSAADTPRFICSVCGRQFRLRQLLAAHTVTHTGERPSVCRYPGCGKRFGQTSTRNYHERTHSELRPYVCSQCGQCFKQPTIFKTHVATVHGGGVRPYCCSQCGKAFKLYGALQTHAKTVHSDERPHACDACPKRFKYRHQLARHERALHSGERPWQCTVCAKSFTQPGNLRTHMRTHTGEKPYSCTLCGHSFAHSGTLKSHLLTHRHTVTDDAARQTHDGTVNSRILTNQQTVAEDSAILTRDYTVMSQLQTIQQATDNNTSHAATATLAFAVYDSQSKMADVGNYWNLIKQ